MTEQRNNEIVVSDREYGVIWRYLPGGPRLHALSAGTYGHAMFSRCGIYYLRGRDWYGTGSQEEYERAAQLPRCRTCVRLVRM